ncbi:MAG: CoA pyrophosphatase [Trueperella sp.]|nr:CoA pyrophosphatase [Trueperella sp.]
MFDQLGAALDSANPMIDGRHPVPEEGMRKAAVLSLFTNDDDPRLILTERARHLRKHAGQISFPGGNRDGRETPEQTALREAMEECAIDSDGVRILGRLPMSSLPVTSYVVTPVVGVWDSVWPLEMVPDPVEVAEIHAVPVSALVDPANRGSWAWTSEVAAMAWRAENGGARLDRDAHLDGGARMDRGAHKDGAGLELTRIARSAQQIQHTGPTFVYGDLVIWGFTAMLLDGLLELAGWAQPWNRDRVIEIPKRFGGW